MAASPNQPSNSGAIMPPPYSIPSSILERTSIYGTEAEWLESREHFIGASEIAGITGHSHWNDATPFNAYLRKTGQDDGIDPDRRKNLNRGNRAEAAILGEYADEHLDLLIEPMRMICVSHPAYPRIRCTPDGLLYTPSASDDPPSLVAGVDAKFMEVYSRKLFGEPGSDEVPSDYVIQALISCECLEVPYWDLAVWFGRNSYVEYRVERNAEVAERIIVQALSWYDKHIVGKVPPEIDGSAAATRFLARSFPRVEPVMAAATERAVALKAAFLVAESTMKAAKDEADNCKNQLRVLCGVNEGIESVCTWKRNKDSEKTDWKAVCRDLESSIPAGVWQEAMANATTIKEGARVLRMKK